MLIPLKFADQSDPGIYNHDGPLRLINAFSESRKDFGTIFYASPGLSSWTTLPYGGPFQGMLDVDGTLYVVANRSVYSVNASGLVAYLGGFPADGPVAITRNRQLPYPQITIAGSQVWGYVQNGVWKIVNNPNMPGPNSATTGDGYTFFSVGNTGAVYASAIDDVTTINALSVATASAFPDTTVRVYSRGSDLIVFCAKHTEFWADVGATPFPYQPIPGTSMKLGCAGAGAVVEIPVTDQDTGVFWVASDGSVRRLVGYTGQTVSNAAVERAIYRTANPSAIVCSGYDIPGHSFLVISGPGWTWEYDVNTGLWHERQSYGMTNWRVSQMTNFSALNGFVAGDDTTGALYLVSQAALDEGGQPFVWTLRALARTFPNRLDASELYLNVIPGTGLNTPVAGEADPQVTIKWSADNGMTFPHQRLLSTGRIGERFKRVRTRRLGLSDENGFLFEISMSAKVIKGMTGGMLDATVLRD